MKTIKNIKVHSKNNGSEITEIYALESQKKYSEVHFRLKSLVSIMLSTDRILVDSTLDPTFSN